MPVKKHYDLAATKAAIDRADYRHINVLKLVRSDVSAQDWERKDVPVMERNPDVPPDLQWPGRKNVGHVFRHVEGTHDPEKTVYADQNTAIAVTCELLNSAEGQAALEKLDEEDRKLYNNTTRRVEASLSGSCYGKRGEGAGLEKILAARCELMKLGDDILWVHSSYPCRFQV